MKIGVCAALLVLLLVVILFYIPRHGVNRSPENQSFRGLSQIGAALDRYREDHAGKLPERFSELVPKYMGTNSLKCFFPPYNKGMVALANANYAEQLHNIDADSAYVYLGNRGVVYGIIAFERPSLIFSSPYVRDGGIDVLTNDGYLRAVRIPANELRRNFKR